MIKWLAGLLLIANVALYLWVGGGGTERAGAVEPDVNKEGMLLVSEARTETGETERVPDANPAAANLANAANGETVEAAVKPSAADPEKPAPAGAGRAALACYRIGPFKGEAGWLAANQWMTAQKFRYTAVRSESREMRAVRVFLGPFDPATAKQMMNGLKEKGIDHYAYLKAQGEVSISLGYFTQEELAEKFIAHLVSQGIKANSRKEYRAIGPFDWMEAAIDTQRRDSLLSRRWPGKGVAVLKVDCREISVPAETGG